MSDTDGRTLPPSDVVSGGEDTHWTIGDKRGFGTVQDHGRDRPRPVWFTLTRGALTEVRFPRIDMMNVRTVEFVVADPDSEYAVRTYEEFRDGDSALDRETEMTRTDSLSYRQTITPRGERAWTLTVEYAVHPDHDAVLLDIDFESHDGRTYDVYATTDLMLSGCGSHDIARRRPEGDTVALTGHHTGDTWDDHVIVERTEVEEERMIGPNDVATADRDDSGERAESADEQSVSDEETDDSDAAASDGTTTRYEEEPYLVAAALTSREGFSWGTVDINGGKAHSSLLESGRPDRIYERAEDKVVLLGRLESSVESLSDTVALGFAEEQDEQAALTEAEAALSTPFERVERRYARSWQSYLDGIDVPESVDGELAAQYRTAAMTVKAADSKRYPGAGIASPSVPWGDKVQADEPADYGYSYVWARDLYQTFTAFEAMGDVQSAIEATEYIYEYQQRDTGFLPQNTFVDGRTRWGGEQMDEIAFPAVMAYQLKERHGYGPESASYSAEDVVRSAGYVAANGPRSQQQRWEEEGGYSPSTVAAEIAGLVAAADIAADAGHRADAIALLGMADHWHRNVEALLATTTGAGGHTNTPYYFRVSDAGDPDTHTMRTHNNGGGTFDEREVIDGGFLELVRLGVRPATDPVVENSVAEYDDELLVETPNGPGWYRYTGAGYGEKDGSEWFRAGVPWSADMRGKGRLWPIFTGERGEYELARPTDDRYFDPAALLATIQRFANEARVLPEQVWDRDDHNPYGWEFGEGTSAATPLCWSNAQYVRLAHSVAAGEPVETPAVVADRYAADAVPDDRPSLSADVPSKAVGGTVTVTGETDAAEVVVWTREEGVRRTVESGAFSVEVTLTGEDRVIVAAATDDPVFEAGIAVTHGEVEYENAETATGSTTGGSAAAPATDPEADEEGSAST